MKQYPLFALLSLLFTFTSCLKEDDPVQRPPAGDEVTLTVDMNSDYKYQIWFDLGTESIIKTSLKTDWDIAFDSDAGEDYVYLNAAKVMQAAKSGQSFEGTTSLDALSFRPDHNTGNPDSLALSGWQVGDVYVLDLGYNPAGALLGHVKLEFLALNDNSLTIRYAQLDGTNEHTATISKNELYNNVAYSFSGHENLYAEPPKDQWDLAFTQYTNIFYDPYTPYLVTGVLINPYQVAVAVDSITPFLNITRDVVESYTYTTVQDAIGYAWKYYSLEESVYTVSPELVYLIKDTEGIHYKLHFIDFYDAQGIKGSPKFEMQRL